jgi:hypothetical protein
VVGAWKRLRFADVALHGAFIDGFDQTGVPEQQCNGPVAESERGVFSKPSPYDGQLDERLTRCCPSVLRSMLDPPAAMD